MAHRGKSEGVADVPSRRLDPVFKIALLLLYSIAVMLAPNWWVLCILVAAVLAAGIAARIPASTMNRLLVPVYVMAAFAVLFNLLAQPNAAGLLSGLFYAVRMLALVAASFVVCLSTSPEDLLRGFLRILAPLRRLRVPVDDIALLLSLALRFIPVIMQEFETVRAAQRSRGAELAGSPMRKLRIAGMAFTSVFVGVFRRASALAASMDARCYGATGTRTYLDDNRADMADGPR